jgi:glycosyltransferase involved in cell wall biosynthesis
MTGRVRIYVVTYERPRLLERALRSLAAQTLGDWVAEVLNDSPSDTRPAEVIDRVRDARIHLSKPSIHRGGTRNFNFAFATVEEPFASILEDDNWWEPTFLETMVAALEARKDRSLAVGNEIIWREQRDGSWVNTGKTIWPPSDAIEEFPCRPLDKCGMAKLCNSAMLFRTHRAEAFQTPDSIPIDVTEHFRERVIPHPILLVRKPLVNYGDTLLTHRSKGHRLLSQHLILLIGSVFTLCPEALRDRMAAVLWSQVRSTRPLARNTLLGAGLFIPEARALWRQSTTRERLLFVRSCARRPGTILYAQRATTEHAAAWKFLQTGWFADFMRTATEI